MTNTYSPMRRSSGPLATDERRTPVTVLGLGPMGAALAAALLERGHPTTVWNRTPGKASPLVAGGARQADTVADAVSASALTLVCLKDYPALYETFASGEGTSASGDAGADTAGYAAGHAASVLKGRTLVNLNSGTPTEARAAAAWADERGAAYLDGAIMVPPPLVGAAGSVTLYSGAQEVFARHAATLESLGEPRHLGTDPSLAVLHNTALLGMMYATMNGFLHAAALVGSTGVRAERFAELALGWFLPSLLDGSLQAQAPDLDRAHYPGDVGTMEMNLNALHHLTRTCEEQGVHSGQPRLMAEIAERAIEQGHGGDNYLAVFEVFKKAAARAV